MGGTRIPLALILSALAALAAVLAGCSGDSPETPADASTPVASASAAASPDTTVEASPSASAPAASTTAAAAAMAFTDSTGTEVTLDGPPQRIISLSPGVTEILFAIGAGDRVVAADEASDYPEAALALEKLAYFEPDPEAALALDPDLVIMATNQEQQVQQFRDLGLPVFLAREPETLEGVVESVRLVGDITGRVPEAAALAGDMEQRIEMVTSAIEDIDEGPLVFFELDAGLYTAGPGTFIGGMLELLKARNVAEDAATDFPQLSSEAVIDRNPDVVLLADAEFGESLDTVAARPGWEAVAAVQQGRVYPVDPDLTNRPGPRIVEGLAAMARALYPDRFE
ncbi:MAG: ABC transporter substrate-binding protein [Dehalococcoidia bacterium]|nr:ABC transporter substrate-binding protein [Dehalococcoidia bacterium]